MPTFRHLHHDANMQAFINESLDYVPLKFRQCAKYLRVYTFLLFAKDFEQNIWDSTKTKVLNS